MTRIPLPPYPNGWFGLCYADEIAPGALKTVHALGQDFVVFRGEDGKIRALGLFQLQYYWWGKHDPKEICADNALAAMLTAKEFTYLQKRFGWAQALRYHIGGSATDQQVRPRLQRFEQLVREWRNAA